MESFRISLHQECMMTSSLSCALSYTRGLQNELAKAANTALETLTTQAELVKKGLQALPAENVEGKAYRPVKQ